MVSSATSTADPPSHVSLQLYARPCDATTNVPDVRAAVRGGSCVGRDSRTRVGHPPSTRCSTHAPDRTHFLYLAENLCVRSRSRGLSTGNTVVLYTYNTTSACTRPHKLTRQRCAGRGAASPPSPASRALCERRGDERHHQPTASQLCAAG
eukprot:5753917-Prymnesium_polylepis.1